MRNYWSLLPAVLVIVGLILVYAVPTIINPQWTSSIMALFRTTAVPDDATPEEARRAAVSSARSSCGPAGCWRSRSSSAPWP